MQENTERKLSERSIQNLNIDCGFTHMGLDAKHFKEYEEDQLKRIEAKLLELEFEQMDMCNLYLILGEEKDLSDLQMQNLLS